MLLSRDIKREWLLSYYANNVQTHVGEVSEDYLPYIIGIIESKKSLEYYSTINNWELLSVGDYIDRRINYGEEC